MLRCFILLLYAPISLGFGYDAGGGDPASCGRPYRSGRMHHPPCNLALETYCTSAGATYPWHAVRRFVRDNQGLMRRMYGDQRHGHVLRAELQEDEEILEEYPPHHRPRSARYKPLTNDIDNDLVEDVAEARYLRDDVSNDDVLNTKFVYSEEPALSIKLAGLKTAPHFRQTSTSTTERTTTTTTTSATTTTTEDSSTMPSSLETESSTDTTTEQTTIGSLSADDRIDEENYSTTTSEGGIEGTTVQDKSSAILFQDMEEEPIKKKPHINYNKLKGVNACPVKEEVVAPFWANNTRGEVLALLNMYPFEQYVHWEKCTFEHRQMYCRDGCRCEQQYRLHRLLAYDPNNECRGIFSDWFRFPSCCVCKCYDMPPEFRVTSRSPRFQQTFLDP